MDEIGVEYIRIKQKETALHRRAAGLSIKPTNAKILKNNSRIAGIFASIVSCSCKWRSLTSV